MKNFIIILILTLITTVICFFIFFEDVFGLNNVSGESEVSQEIEKDLESEKVNVSKYLVYGTHLNIYGELKFDLEESESVVEDVIDSVTLVLKNEETLEEVEYEIKYEVVDNVLNFYTSDELNSGINLENLTLGKNIVLLKIDYNLSNDNDNVSKYYSLINNTEYENITYYTITKNDRNNKIDIAFNGSLSNNSSSIMSINVEDTVLPDNVYDIVIDPGHGGEDCGADVGESYTESEINLKYAIALKTKLESLGLKVKLTRDDDSYIETYGEDGRCVIPNDVSAKLMLSIHLNSSEYDMKEGGLEIYLASNLNTNLASLLAKNIVSGAGTTYSPKTVYKVGNGVYVRNFTSDEIDESASEANELNYEEYNITEATSYFGIIRENGGIATNAYMDGRNTEYGANKYYDSNVGVETYLLELGYMTCEDDYTNIVNKKSEYVNSIAKSLETYLGI